MTDDLTPSQESAVRNAMNAARLRAEVARLTAELKAAREDYYEVVVMVGRIAAENEAVRAYANHQHNIVGALFSGPDVIAVMDEAKVGGS